MSEEDRMEIDQRLINRSLDITLGFDLLGEIGFKGGLPTDPAKEGVSNE